MKRCSRCKIEKEEICFGKNKNQKDGLNLWCKECACASRRLYYQNNIELEHQRMREYHHKRQANDAEFRKKRCDRNKVYSKKYYGTPHGKEKRSLQMKRLMQNPKYRVARQMRFNVWRSLQNQLTGKNGKAGRHWEDLVGYTIEKLMEHLESKFGPGMTWDNYGEGGWQIDHIVPMSWFDIKEAGDAEFKRCWLLGNLQPLWHKENASKGNRYAG